MKRTGLFEVLDSGEKTEFSDIIKKDDTGFPGIIQQSKKIECTVFSSHKKGRNSKGQFALGNRLAVGKGRPRKYKDPQQLAERADDYFNTLGDRYPTTSGLALHLGFADRSSLTQYKRKEEFRDSIKRALLIIEASYEERLYEPNCKGAIFALKNFGWKG